MKHIKIQCDLCDKWLMDMDVCKEAKLTVERGITYSFELCPDCWKLLAGSMFKRIGNKILKKWREQ